MKSTIKNKMKMKHYHIIAGMMAGLALLMSACDSDLDHNPTLQTPSKFVLNTPASTNSTIDLDNSKTINLTCSQPDYGFPANTVYTVEVATKSDMSDAVTLSQTFNSATLSLDAAELASTLTTQEVSQGKSEADFPLTIPVYFRATAQVKSASTNKLLESTKIQSNVVALKSVRLKFALPPVTCPDNLYLIGNFCGWDWDKSVTMAEAYGSRDNANSTATFWHMVYIDGGGIKFNSTKAWNGSEVGYKGITIDPASDNAGTIQSTADGNISSSTPGWYLMIVKTTVNGRNIDYTVTFNKPNVYLIGEAVGGWDEGNAAGLFTVPSTADGDFVSPTLPALAGDDTGCIRIYCKVPGYDWWKSEFIVGGSFGKTITYRGNGGDQARVGAAAGTKIYLNFSTDTGDVKE